jgi:hypothetical protein
MRKLIGRLSTIAVLYGATLVFAQPRDGAAAAFSCTIFPATSSEADLVGAFGRENVSDERVFGSDDGPVPGSVLFANDAERRIEIAWRNPETKSNPAWVRAGEDTRQWRSPHGISPGMTLRDVEQLNRWPFRLGGFMLERGQGLVRSWGSGRLQEFEEPDCPLKVQFQPRRHADADFSLSGQLMRGNEFSSGHPAMQASNPVVVGLWISYGW